MSATSPKRKRGRIEPRLRFRLVKVTASRKQLAKTFQVLPQQLAQILWMHVIVVQEIQHQRLPFARRLQLRLQAELLDLVQIELPFLAEESAMQRVGLLRAQDAPRAIDLRHAHAYHRAIVPRDVELRLHLTQKL